MKLKFSNNNILFLFFQAGSTELPGGQNNEKRLVITGADI